jgi:XTP/dITP diphosphohydrolase
VSVPVPTGPGVDPHRQLTRLIEVMDRLRVECPWDRAQSHRSLVPYLVEETCETVEAIESGDADHLREELGDLLLQVVFHAKLAAEAPGGFDVDDVAAGIADKLVARHPHVFAGEQAPEDLHGVWEQRKAAEKQRTSALDGIPEQLSALSRGAKAIGRARSHRVPLELPVEPDEQPDEPLGPDQLGDRILGLVARGQSAGIDAEQATRDAVRRLEASIRAAERRGDR